MEVVEDAGALEVEIFELLLEVGFDALVGLAFGALVLLAFDVFGFPAACHS